MQGLQCSQARIQSEDTMAEYSTATVASESELAILRAWKEPGLVEIFSARRLAREVRECGNDLIADHAIIQAEFP